LQPRIVDLHQLMRDLDPLMRQAIGERIRLSMQLRADPSTVKVDPGQMEQVLLNLATNARDAMPDGGQLLIETSNESISGEEGAVDAGMQPGPQVVIAVTDTGVGMDAETQRRAFEPFFTSKEQGKGTGLGLATVYGVIKQSGGDIHIHSAPAAGTTFKICLPLATDNTTAETAEPAVGEHLGGTETVLILEDERPLRRLAAEVMSGAGYRILDAGDGGEALQVASNFAGPIHLLVSDIVTPVLPGPEVARRLCEQRPEMRVLFMSGYSEAFSGPDEDAAFLAKPFTPGELLAAVRRTLDGMPAGGNQSS
jgi:two-component system cell cycle sensor histidine kinase/response regulator CckA